MNSAAVYCRVSTDKEDQQNSFLSQKAYFTNYIEHAENIKLYDIYADEGLSGTTTKNRTGFIRMMEDAKEGKFQILLTKEVSRFSRNILDTIQYTRELKAHGVAVLFLTDNINTMDPDAELRLTIMASIAQEESRRTSCRVVWGQTRQMERGIVFGHSLLGYDVENGKIKVNEDGAVIVREIFRKYALEHLGTSQIARELTEQGIRTGSGYEKWSSSGVIKILKNEKYVGDLVQKKTYTPDYLTHKKRTNKGEVAAVIIRNHHQPIISREVWDAAQRRIAKNHKKTEKQVASGLLPFSGRIFCGNCGSVFLSRYRKDRGRIWRCANAVKNGKTGCCIGKQLRDDEAYALFCDTLKTLKIDKHLICNSIVSALTAEDKVKAYRGYNAEITCLRLKRNRLLDLYLSEKITEEEWADMRVRYDSKIEELEKKEAYAQRELDGPSLEQFMNDEILDARFKEAAVRRMVERITVCSGKSIEMKLYHIPYPFLFFEQTV